MGVPRTVHSPPGSQRLSPTSTSSSAAWCFATRAIIQTVLVAAGYEVYLAAGVSLQLAAVAATVPLWWPVLRSYSMIGIVLALSLAALAWGLYLAEASRTDHLVVRSLQVSATVHILNGLALVVVLLWARLHLPLHRIAALFGGGAIIDALLNSPRGWKFDLGVPAVILVVGYLHRYRSQWWSVATLLVFGAVGILDEGRSYAAFCVATAGLAVWQMRPMADDRPTSRWYPAALLSAMLVVVYTAASRLLTSGVLGPEVQRRSVAQIEATGSLISGGRPEWAATRALFQHRPQGYGVGVVPTLTDHAIARAGLASINVETGGYLTNYMMGGQFRLHGVTSDLWVSYGVVGLALAGAIIYALARSLSTLLSQRKAPIVVIFVTLLAFWHLAFGPIFSNWPDVCVALGLALLVKSNDQRYVARDQRYTSGIDAA